MNIHRYVLTASALVPLAGCVAQASPQQDAREVPSVDEDGVAEAAKITSGSHTADAKVPKTPNIGGQILFGELSAGAVFTGPATRKMGVCLLQVTSTACNTVADCGSSPSPLPTGGSRYCTNINNVGQKYCAFRPGAAASYCAGTPANGGVAIAAGSYSTPRRAVSPDVAYVSYACFEGCAATDPSVSSEGRTLVLGVDVCYGPNGDLVVCE